MDRLKDLAKTKNRAVEYMMREITHICKDMKKRAPGSAGEREAAEYMAAKLREDCGLENVAVESFEEHPAAFYGYFYFSAFFDIMSWVLYFVNPVLSIISAGVAMLLFIVQFIMYKQVIDGLFPKKTSTNITAIKPCSGEVKQRILLNGHIDAAWEFPLNYKFGGVVFEIPGAMALVGVLYNIAISCFALSGAEWARTAFMCGLIFVPFYALVAFTYNPRRVVDGANDNLSGCYMGMAILREMKLEGITLENTEVGVILTGSEEAGLRGAKAWGEKHKDDFKDVPTFIVSYDTIHDPARLMVNERDLNGTVKADKELCDLFMEAGKELGLPIKRGWVPPFGGATDSAAFTQSGFRSIGITGLNHKLEDYYHTRRDTYDNMNKEGLTNCYEITLKVIEKLEAGEN